MKFLSSALLFALVAALPASAGDEDLAFQRTIDLLHVQMKIQVLQKLRDSGFHVPNDWVQRYLDEQQEIGRELDQASLVDVAKLDEWAVEAEKVEKAETDTLEKLAEDWGKKTLKALTDGAGDKESKDKGILTVWREYEVKRATWAAKDKRRALELARDVQELIGKLRADAKASGPAVTDAEKAWRRDMMRLYRGAIDDRLKLTDGLIRIERERMYAMGCLKAMREVTAGLKLIEMAEDDKSKAKKVCEAARDKVAKYLEERYGGGDETAKENIKWGVEKIYAALESAYGAWEKCDEFDKDPLLRANPLALSTCKRMAALSAMYSSVLDVAKEIVILAPLKPLFDVLEFYGKAFELVPQFARAMQGMVNTVDQDVVDIREFSAWNVVPAENEHLVRTPLMAQYGVMIAKRGKLYYLLVPEDVLPRKYATLDETQYRRLTQAIADERAIFALHEASRGMKALVTENVFDWAPADFLAAGASPAYLKDLREKSRKHPFTEGDLLKLAQGTDVTHDEHPERKSKTWTAENFRTTCEKLVDDLAEQLTIRSALKGYDREMKLSWLKFKAMLRENPVALSPQQIVKLFSFHQQGAQPEKVREWLKRTAEQRKLSQTGAARIGIPLVTSDPSGERLKPGSQVKIVAHAVISDLAKDRAVDAAAVWKVPAWAVIPPPSILKVKNGRLKVETTLVVPASAAGKDFEVTLTIRVPLEKGEAVAEGGIVLPVGALPKPPEIPSKPEPPVVDPKPPPKDPPAQPAKAPVNEFLGTGEFGVDAGGPLTLTISRYEREYEARTKIVVKSQTLAGLDPKTYDPKVKLELQRCFGEDEPWVVAYTVSLGGNQEIRKAQDIWGRMSEDTWVITELLSSRDDKKLPHRLGHYRMRQVLVDKDGKETGKEIFSNVVRPSGKGTIRLPRWATVTDGAVKASFGRGYDGLADIALRFSSDDQAFDAWEAHFVVKAGGWTGHAWSNTNSRSNPTDWENSFASIYFPYKPGGLSLEVTAEGNGLKLAKGSFKIAPHPEWEESMRTALKTAQDKADRLRKELQDRIKSWKETIASQEKNAREAATPEERASAQSGADSNKLYLRVQEEFELPLVEAELEADTGRCTGDPRRSIEARQKRIALAETKRDILIAIEDFNEAAARRESAKSAESAKWLPERLESHARARDKAREECRNDIRNANWYLRQHAIAAGDPALYVKAAVASIGDDPIEDGSDAENVASLLKDAAEAVVLIAGTRQGAADTWEYALSMQATLRKYDDKLKAEVSAALPRWWPSERTFAWHGGPFDIETAKAVVARCASGK